MESSSHLNATNIVGCSITGLMLLVSYIVAQRCGRQRSRADVLIIWWLCWDLALHYFSELLFVVFSLTTPIGQSEHWIVLHVKDYGKADKRWLTDDPTLTSVLLFRVVTTTPLIVGLVYAISADKQYRHFLQITIAVLELFAGWMTFCPEWLTGSPNLVTDNWLYFWVFFVFFNGVFVVVPVAMLYHSWVAIRQLHSTRRKKSP